MGSYTQLPTKKILNKDINHVRANVRLTILGTNMNTMITKFTFSTRALRRLLLP